jgi:hypothetical protein
MDKSDLVDNNTFEKDLINKRLDRNDWNSVEIAVDYNTKQVFNALTGYVSTKFEPTRINILDNYKINILEKEIIKDKHNDNAQDNKTEEYELPESWEDEIKIIEKVNEIEPEDTLPQIKKTKKTIQLKNNKNKNNSNNQNINKENNIEKTIKEDIINEKALGEEAYLVVRKYISDTDLGLITKTKDINNDIEVVSKKDNKKIKVPKLTSAEKIKKDLSDKRLIEATKQLISDFEESKELNYDMYIKDGFLPKSYIEFTGLTFMHCSNILLTMSSMSKSNMSKSEKYKKLTHKREYYELIISIQKFISNVKNTKCLYFLDTNQKINISTTLLLDIETWLNKLIAYNDFDGLQLIKTNPELVYRTKYDKCFSSSMATKKIRLRPSQIQLIDFLVENYTDNFLIEYCSGVGSGKTTLLATAIPMFVREYNSVNQYNKKIALLCCTSIVVKRDMANIAYNAGIHFAMGIQDNLYSNTKSNYRITYQHNSSPDNLEAIICTAECAYSLLMEEEKNIKENGGRNKYILLFDEPTMGADQPNSDTLRDCMKLFSVLPNQSILSSATMCELSSMPDFIKDINIKYKNLRTINIRDSSIQIGCTISTFDNILVLPHNGCTNMNNLQTCITTISKNSFLCRMYTIQVAGFLYNLTKKFKMNQKDIPDIKIIFKNINNLESNKVVQICLDILTKVCETQDNKLIYDFCNVEFIEEPIIDNPDTQDTQDTQDINSESKFENNKSSSIHTIFNNIGRTEAYKYTNMNLIVDTNPVEFVETYFKDLIDELYTQIHSCSNIISKYKNLQKKYNDEKDLIEKTIKSEDERIKKYNILIKSEPFLCVPSDNNKPSLFPPYFQINTKDHMQHYSPNNIKNDNTYRISLPLENIPFDDFSLPDWIIACLFCGIGIYSPNNMIFKNNHSYNQTVLQLASKGQLAYLVSDYSICYGTNYPIYRVFITENFSNICSVNTLFQVLGRTGRVGKSWIGSAYLSNTGARKLIKSIQDDKDGSNKLEPINMQNMFNRILNENIKENNKNNIIMDNLENYESSKDLGIRIEFNPVKNTKPDTEPETEPDTEHNNIPEIIIAPKKAYTPPYLLQTNKPNIKPTKSSSNIKPNKPISNIRPDKFEDKIKDNSKESWSRV